MMVVEKLRLAGMRSKQERLEKKLRSYESPSGEVLQKKGFS